MTSETASTSTEAALALLDLPALDDLTQEKVRGAACIWCSVILTAETAVNLGERKHKRPGGCFYTFPRSCRPCARKAFDDALKAHAGCCMLCAIDANLCETATAIRQLMRECQR